MNGRAGIFAITPDSVWIVWIFEGCIRCSLLTKFIWTFVTYSSICVCICLLSDIWTSSMVQRGWSVCCVVVWVCCVSRPWCAFLQQAASALPASAFAQYKGELVISLKYVPPKNPATEKIKGKTLTLFLALAVLFFFILWLNFLNVSRLPLIREKGGEWGGRRTARPR